MNRSDLVAELAALFNQLTQLDTEMAVNAILETMHDTLSKGHRIEIRGLGVFG